MANSALEHIASYSTPGQTQPPQPEEQGKENDETPGQKRKRPAQEAPQLDQATQHGEGRQNTPQPTPSEQHRPPPHVTPSPAGPLPNYSMPQFNRARSQCNGHYNRTPDLGKCMMWWDTWDLARYTILDAKVLDRYVTWLTKHKDTS